MDIHSKDLLNIIKNVTPVVPSKAIVPAWECVLVDVSDKNISVYTTDGEFFVTHCSVYEGDDINLKFCVNAKFFEQLLKSLDEYLQLEYDEETFTLVVKSDKGEYKIQGEDPSDFIMQEQDEIEAITEIDLKVFNEIFACLKNCINNDNLRPSMQYINMTSNYCYATNGHLLGRYKHNVALENSILIHPSLSKFIPSDGSTVSIYKSGTSLIYEFENTTVNIIECDHKFPDVNSVLDRLEQNEPSSTVYVNKHDIIPTLNRANKINTTVELISKDEKLSIKAKDYDHEHEMIEGINYKYDMTSQNFHVKLNGKFLQSIIGVADTDKDDLIGINYYDPSKPVVINGDLTYYLIMPIVH